MAERARVLPGLQWCERYPLSAPRAARTPRTVQRKGANTGRPVRSHPGRRPARPQDAGEPATARQEPASARGPRIRSARTADPQEGPNAKARRREPASAQAGRNGKRSRPAGPKEDAEADGGSAGPRRRGSEPNGRTAPSRNGQGRPAGWRERSPRSAGQNRPRTAVEIRQGRTAGGNAGCCAPIRFRRSTAGATDHRGGARGDIRPGRCRSRLRQLHRRRPRRCRPQRPHRSRKWLCRCRRAPRHRSRHPPLRLPRRRSLRYRRPDRPLRRSRNSPSRAGGSSGDGSP